MTKPSVISLMGPTASGKTDIAVALAARFPLQLISVDSALIYRDMDIGTAKPSEALLAQAPHALINILDPDQRYSVAQFCQDVEHEIQQALAAGRIPLLVGGTMMYFRGLQQGLAAMPEADQGLRQQLEQRAQQEGWPALHQQLAQLDPESAARIKPTDSQRLQRALEVCLVAGQPMSALWQQSLEQTEYRFHNLALLPNQRSWLHQRIAQRFDQMLAQGFVDEVVALRERFQLTAELPSMRCVGYRQVWQYLEGEDNAEQMREKGIAATRQLAKRQITWLRKWPDCRYFEPLSPNLMDDVLKWMHQEPILGNNNSC